MDEEQYKIVIEAMDIHAQQVCIMFQDWIYSNGYYRDERDVWYYRNGEGIAFTTQDLFQIFKQEICKSKT